MHNLEKLLELIKIFKYRGFERGFEVLRKYLLGLYFLKPDDFPAPLTDNRVVKRDWINILEERTHKLVGVEIGVHQGAHAEYLLENLDLKSLYLIDPYVNYDKYEETWHTGDFNRHEQLAKQRLNHCGEISFVKSMSNEAVDIIPNKLDFVYIDGNHDYKFVMQDILNYYPKLSKNGILAGHDYTHGWPGVMEAVDNFATDENLDVNRDNGGDWYILKPPSGTTRPL